MSKRIDEIAFFEWSKGKSLTPAEQEAFHAGWQARTLHAKQEKEKLMTSAKWTPGPWVKDYGNTTWHIKSIANPIKGAPIVAAYRAAVSLTESEKEANAHLIAAAPELYDALDAFERAADLWLPAKCGLEHVGEVKALHSLREKMLAALSKAKGETND